MPIRTAIVSGDQFPLICASYDTTPVLYVIFAQDEWREQPKQVHQVLGT